MRGHLNQPDFLLLTTEPGWTFATLVELRDRGIRDFIPFFHRDSTLVIPSPTKDAKAVQTDGLQTPASVFGGIFLANGRPGSDASVGLRDQLHSGLLRTKVQRWHSEEALRDQQYCIVSEAYGRTQVMRRRLAQLLDWTVQQAFPRWHKSSRGPHLFLAKTDREFGAIGVQLHTNLSRETTGRPGELRSYLAAGLLTLARVQPGETVLDPFMGTGTILRVAREQFGAHRCIGIETTPAAYTIAARTLQAYDVRLFQSSFDRVDVSGFPDNLKIVTNLPFGVKFPQISDGRLIRFFSMLQPRVRRFALLVGRDQAIELAHHLNLVVKNVLVLGQRAAIAYSPIDGRL